MKDLERKAALASGKPHPLWDAGGSRGRSPKPVAMQGQNSGIFAGRTGRMETQRVGAFFPLKKNDLNGMYSYRPI